MFSVCSINVNVNGNVDVNFAKYRNTTRVRSLVSNMIGHSRQIKGGKHIDIPPYFLLYYRKDAEPRQKLALERLEDNLLELTIFIPGLSRAQIRFMFI